MTEKEIKLFIRFLKDENFYFQYKKLFYSQEFGFNRRKHDCGSVFNGKETILKFLARVNEERAFRGFWWGITNISIYYLTISNLNKKWLIYISKFKI